MQRTAFFCLIGVMFLFVRPTTADDKKDARKTLAEEAKWLGDKNGDWISDDTGDVTIKKKEKAALTIRFVPADGKASGMAALGMAVLKPKEGTWAATEGYKFELIEEDGKRAIKLTSPGAKEPHILNYSVAGDKLTINIGLELWGGTVPMQFKRGTGIEKTLK